MAHHTKPWRECRVERLNGGMPSKGMLASVSSWEARRSGVVGPVSNTRFDLAAEADPRDLPGFSLAGFDGRVSALVSGSGLGLSGGGAIRSPSWPATGQCNPRMGP